MKSGCFFPVCWAHVSASLFTLIAFCRVDAGVTLTHFGGPDFIIDGGSTVVYVDPLPPNAANFIRHFRAFRDTNKPVPDIVVITHNHGDHMSVTGIQQLLKLNPKLVVVAPLDSHDALGTIVPEGQLLTPAPKPGKPVILTQKDAKITVYRTVHGWLTDDLLPYSLSYPFHHSYVVEIGGFRVLISGDSYEYQEMARDFQKVDAVLWHIYKPSDLFDLQALQTRFSPSYIIPYHLNIKYGLSQPDMAALTDRYRFEGLNAVYLTAESRSVVLEKQPAAMAPPHPLPATPAVDLDLGIDHFFRGIQPPLTVQLVVSVRNDRPADIKGTVELNLPDGWKATPLDAVEFPRLEPGRDFLCRFKIEASADIAFDGQHDYAVTAKLTTSTGSLVKEFRFGGGRISAWNILGPFDNVTGRESSPLEPGVDLLRTYVGRGGAPLRWTPYASRDLQSGYVDMAGVFDMRETFAPQLTVTNPKYVRDREQAVGYAVSYVDSPIAQDVTCNVGAPYGLHLFVNGQHTFEMPGYDFNFNSSKAAVPVHLNKGRNTLLIKIVRGKLPEWNLTPWMGFFLRMTDSEQNTLRNLVFSRE